MSDEMSDEETFERYPGFRNTKVPDFKPISCTRCGAQTNSLGAPEKTECDCKYHRLSNSPRKVGKSGLRSRVWAKTDGKCWYCGKQTNPWIDFCIDHVVAQSDGGSHDFANLVPCCRRCNGQKKNMDLESFRNSIAKKSGKVFTAQQIDYLNKIGVKLPEQEEKKHVFYFELNGLAA